MDLHATKTDGFNAPNTITTLTGHVIATQGTLKATGDKALVYIDGDTQISRIVITVDKGKLAHIEQVDDAGNLMTGDADKLDYDNINGIAVLTGHAVVHQQGRGEAHGDKLTYNTQTAYMTGDSQGDGQVHMIFLPKPKPATASPAPAKTASPANAKATPSTAKPASASSTPATPSTVSAPASSSSTPAKGQP
ncbi:lipopolysaccharide transport periplasmic protein LptA [Rhodanobacter sp. C01]|uniref:lipopolysaccharide transport periplasmic protein LptA n=1 Tax=Rhodanobacter sp. C01 TaxID=1945856 RepID=UPI0009D214A8|nr:lipopolysaccharide transport periplasmic protein LptA [Rhodanobacter sp. C01]